MRLKIIRVVIIFLFLILAMDLIYVQALKGNYFYRLSVNNRIRVIPLEPQRGRIFDRNGNVLAESRLSFDVTVIPQDVLDKDMLFTYLGQVLKIDKKEIAARYQQRMYTPFAPVVLIEDVDKQTAMVLEENRFRFPGLYIQETFQRWYPSGKTAAHVVGYVSKIDSQKIKKLKNYGYSQQSIVGYSGVEEYYDQYLMGEEGGLQIEVNSRGQQVQLLGIRQPEPGRDIHLTIDVRMQEISSKVMEDKAGSIVLMDLDSGEILCLVSSPGYDPNVFTDLKRAKERNRLFIEPASPVLNRVIKGQYPPGSVFKTVMSVAGLSEEKVNRNTTYHCPGFYKLGNRNFKCAHIHYSQNIIQALGHSCNVFYYNLGLVIGPELITRYAHKLGLGELTHIDLPSEERGFIPGPRNRRGEKTGWYKGDTLNFSIGQGEVLVTPIQVVRMMAAVAKGSIPQVHLLKMIENEPLVTNSIIKVIGLRKDVMDTVHEGLRAAVVSSSGSARQMNMAGFEVYGKTGTAQTVKGKKTHAWFAGYNLQGSRRMAFCVFLEYGGSSYYAVQVTSDLFKALRKENLI
ncbi:MAG: penicillin-binding protein 2 [Candidatus Omnitrophota bacterium]